MLWFFIIIATIIIVAIGISASKQKKEDSIILKTKGKETLAFELTGIHFPENRRYISGFVKEGDQVFLEFEPENKYDENAIQVLHGGVQIGYVPSHEIDEVKDFMIKYEYHALIYKKENQSGGYLYMEIGLIQK